MPRNATKQTAALKAAVDRVNAVQPPATIPPSAPESTDPITGQPDGQPADLPPPAYEELAARPDGAASNPYTPEVLAAILTAEDARASFLGVYQGRAFFSEQKYATRVRHALETGRIVAPSTRKARHVDIEAKTLAHTLRLMAAHVDARDGYMYRVPRDVSELCEEDVNQWRADYENGALADASAELLAEAKETSRAAGERTGASESLTESLTAALVACKGTMDTVAACTAAREALRAAFEPFKAGSTLAKRMLVDF